jgi:hypothetical protein
MRVEEEEGPSSPLRMLTINASTSVDPRASTAEALFLETTSVFFPFLAVSTAGNGNAAFGPDGRSSSSFLFAELNGNSF